MTFDEAYQTLTADVKKRPEDYAIGNFGIKNLEVEIGGYDVGKYFLLFVSYSSPPTDDIIPDDTVFLVDKKTSEILIGSYMDYYDKLGTKYHEVKLSNAITKQCSPRMWG